MKINYYATKNVCDALFPLLRPNSRVVHVSSRMGLLSWIKNKKIKEKFWKKDKIIQDVDSLMEDYLKFNYFLANFTIIKGFIF